MVCLELNNIDVITEFREKNLKYENWWKISQCISVCVGHQRDALSNRILSIV